MMMTATMCPNPEKLKALSLGQLSSEESDDLIAHVQSCTVCQIDLETVNDAEDSLIASLRDPDELVNFDTEPNCQVAVAKALGAIVNAGNEEPAADFLVDFPRHIGEYEIVRPLGRGGMGSVYLAKHTKLGREVAIKVLARNRLGDQRAHERFEAEMQAVGQLSHPNIVTAHDAREVAGMAVLVTEYIDGLDLGQVLQRTGPLSIANACEIIRQVAVALEYTSGQGFVHRDVKPSNIMLGRNGDVKLLDLGLARFQFADADRSELTGTGHTMGTADFIAPEQVTDSRGVDVRSDIYSLGCTFFKLLTGTAPFADVCHTTAFAKMTAHVSSPAPSLADHCPDAPGTLVKLVDAMLAKVPELRPQSPRQVAEELTSHTEGSDLLRLAEQADQKEPMARKVIRQASSSVATAQSKTFWQRQVPVGLLIATALCALAAGFFLGVMVTIRYPDGTIAKIHVPEGGQVTVAPTTDEEDKNSLPATNVPSKTTPSVAAQQTEEPFFFAVLSDDNDSAVQQTGKRGLVRWRNSGPIVTDTGTWYPLAEKIDKPDNQQYARIDDSPDARIRWKDMQGHISVTLGNIGGNETQIDMQFDEELATKMKRLSAANINRRLGIIFNNRLIVSAPRIRSVIGERAQIAGRFTKLEAEYLMHALQGGSVAPLPDDGGTDARKNDQPTSVDESTSLVDRLQGVWRVTSAFDGGRAFPRSEHLMMAFQGDRFYLVEGDQMGKGTFEQVVFSESNRDAALPFAVDLHDEKSGDMLGILQFPSNGKAMLCFNERGAPRPSAFKSEPDSPNDVLITMERLEVRLMPTDIERQLKSIDSQLPSGDATGKADWGGKASSLLAEERLHQLGLALINFESAHHYVPASAATVHDGSQTQPFSWRVAILPFIERFDLYEQYRFDEPWDSPNNRKLLDQMPDVFRSPMAPEDQKPGETNYLGFAGDNSALGLSKGVQLDPFAEDTLLIVETKVTVPWTKPEDFKFEKAEDAMQAFPWDNQPLRCVLTNGKVRNIDVYPWQELAKLIIRDKSGVWPVPATP